MLIPDDKRHALVDAKSDKTSGGRGVQKRADPPPLTQHKTSVRLLEMLDTEERILDAAETERSSGIG